MSVSVRSSYQPALGGARGATLSTSRHSNNGAILRSAAANNIMGGDTSSRHA